MRRRRSATLVAAIFALTVVGGCSTTDEPDTSQVGSRDDPTTVPDDAGSGGTIQLVAQSTGQVEVWEAADDDATSQMLSASTEASGVLTFLVVEALDDVWLEVKLPVPPPGSGGFVQAEDVSLSRHRYQIVVSRSAHTMTVLAGGVEAMSEPVTIGPDAPVAGTQTFIKELLIPPDGTPYGDQVYGLAGWSSTEQQFGAGAGVVAIHAAAPAALGTDTLTGAIGTDAGVLARLVGDVGLPLGTPVTITP